MGDLRHLAQGQATEGLHQEAAQPVPQLGLGQMGDAQTHQVEQLGREQRDDGDDGPHPRVGRPALQVALLQPDGRHVPERDERHHRQDRPDRGQDAREDHRPASGSYEVTDGDSHCFSSCC